MGLTKLNPSVGSVVRMTKLAPMSDAGLTAIVKTSNGIGAWAVDRSSFNRPTTHGELWCNLLDGHVEVIIDGPRDPRTLAVSSCGVFAIIDANDLPPGCMRGCGESGSRPEAFERAFARATLNYSNRTTGYWSKVERLQLPWESRFPLLVGPSGALPTVTPPEQKAADMFPHRCDSCGARCYRGLSIVEHERPNGCPIGR